MPMVSDTKVDGQYTASKATKAWKIVLSIAVATFLLGLQAQPVDGRYKAASWTHSDCRHMAFNGAVAVHVCSTLCAKLERRGCGLVES